MRFTKTVLGAAVAAIAVGAATAQAESFIDDSSLSITYKQDYRLEDDINTSTKKDGYEDYVHGFRIDYKSGFFMDMIGFDYSYDTVMDLGTDEKRGANTKQGGGNQGGGNLPYDKSSLANNEKKYNDIGGTSQAYLKAKFGDEDLNAYLTAGKRQRSFETYGDSGSRVKRAASVGYDVNANIYGVNVYAAHLNKFGPRNQSFFAEDMNDGKGNRVDYVNIVGAGYELDNGLGFAYEHGESKDAIKKDFAKVYYSLPIQDGMSLDLDGRYAIAKENGKLAENLTGDADYKSKYYNMTAKLNVQSTYLLAGYSKVSQGDFYNGYFDQDNGTFNSSTSLEYDYNLEGERAWFVGTGYDFAGVGIDGLTYDTWYARGTGAKETTGSRHEWVNEVRYSFSGQLDGLSVAWYNATARGYNSVGGKKDGHYNYNKVTLDYTYAIF